MDIDISVFLTEEHKEAIREKIMETIKDMDTSFIIKEIKDAIQDCHFGDYIIEELDYSEAASIIQNKISKALK